MPPATSPAGKPGEVIRRWRNELDKRQEDLANEAHVSQKLISELERGEQDLMSAGIGRVTNIVRALDKTLHDLQNETGIDLALYGSDGSVQEYQVKRVSKPRLRPIPAELQEMIDEKSELAPELADERWQQYLAGQRFSTGRATAERWWNLYLVIKNAGIEPGGN